jgi:hypothetical protein
MRAPRSRQADQRLRELLTRDHSLNGGILFGLDGHVIEVQARAMEVLRRPMPWTAATDISGMAGVPVASGRGRHHTAATTGVIRPSHLAAANHSPQKKLFVQKRLARIRQ